MGIEQSGIERLSIRVLPDGRISRRDAATLLGRTAKTLAMWATEKRGPQPIKSGGRVFYRFDEVQRLASGRSEVAA